MKISSAAISLIAVMSQPNGGRSQVLLRGGDSKVALASDVGGHDSSLKKPNPTFPIIHASPTKRCHAPDPNDPNFVPKDIPPGFVPKNCYGTPVPREKKEIPSHRERKDNPPNVPHKDRKKPPGPPVELEQTGPSSVDPLAVAPPGCIVGWPNTVGDGYCDKRGGYNTAACNYDGGDCCYSTCMDSRTYKCGDNGYDGYDCKDPYGWGSWPGPGCEVANPTWVGDGWCDKDGNYNTEACGYDGGDCCEYGSNKCRDFGVAPWSCGYNGYDCKDHTNCVVDYPEFIGNGYCNKSGGYNTEACGYDGGDCCKSTCENGIFNCGGYIYGVGGYDCLDPNAPKEEALN